MSKKVLVIDSSIAGVSGDMLVSAALDLGADESGVLEAMLSVKEHIDGVERIEAKFVDVIKHGFRAKHLELQIEENISDRSGSSLENILQDSLNDLNISRDAREFAGKSLQELILAESSIHGKDPEKVHLHEAGSADTFVDILGASYALDNLNIFTDTDVVSMPVAVGGGELQFSHGKMVNPSPAVLEIARRNNIRIVGGPVKVETATPTGLAMLSAISDRSMDYYPAINPLAIGIGAGTRDLGVIPNILRMTIGESIEDISSEEIFILETNLDDVTGEEMAHAMEKIMDQGAKDVSLMHTIGKKGRPGFLLRVISDRYMIENLSDLIMSETGTLGVRIMPTTRHTAKREIIQQQVRFGESVETISLKVSRGSSGEIIRIKPEYDEVKELTRKYKRPIRILMEEIIEQAKRQLSS